MFDTEALLRPIREGAPAGDNLRDDPSPASVYYRIKDARNTARSLERAAQMSDDPERAPAADWGPVLELAPRVLAESSKDLEVAAWLIEAQARENGFAGLRQGFELVRRLLEACWDGLHPLPDEEGMATRVAPLAGLNGDEAEGTLIVPIGMVPLLHAEHGALSAWLYRSAREIAAIADPELKQRRIDAGGATLERFHAAVAAANPAELFARRDEVELCLREFEALSRTLDERCGKAAPPTSNIRQTLQDVLDCLGYLTKDLARPEQNGALSGGDAGQSAGPSRSAGGGIPGVIATRQDALEALRLARDYFRKSEPHSPVSYVIDQAIRWSQMPLHLLVGELIPDPSALASFQLRTGVPPQDSPTQPI